MKQLYDFVRGLSPYPAAWTELEGPDGKVQTLKIYVARKEEQSESLRESVGTVVVEDGMLKVAAQDGFLLVDELQLAGKKRMRTADFLRGFRFDGNYKMR